VKHPEMVRPFKVPLYPITPIVGIILYILAIAFSGINIIVVGGIWCLVGVGYYYLFGKKSRKKHLVTIGESGSKVSL